MSCQIRSEEHTDHLMAYAAGKLSADKACNLESHIRGCEDCTAFVKSQSTIWSLLDTWEARPVSADFDRRLYARIDAAESASWLDRITTAINEFLRPVLARPAFPLAAASMVIVAGFLLDHPGKVLQPANQQASLHVSSFDKVEVDQVEATLADMEMLRQFDDKSDDSKSM